MKKRYLAMFMAVSMMVSSVLCDTGMQTVMAAEMPVEAESTKEILETESAEEESAEKESSEEVLEDAEVQSAEAEDREISAETGNAEVLTEQEISAEEGSSEKEADRMPEDMDAEAELLSEEEPAGDSVKEEGEKNEESSSEAVLDEAEETKNQNAETENQESSAEIEAKEEKTEEQETEERAEESQSEEIIEETENMASALEENARNIVYEGKSNDISWSIDEEGLLLVTGSGDYEDSFDIYNRNRIAPWYEYREAVSSAKVTVTGMTDASYMFDGCSNLSSVDVSNFDTVQVTDMSAMFSGCSNLSSVDVSSFDTVQVTDMSAMFSGCSNLSSVDVSSFDTVQVTDMSAMFSGCSNLSSVDVSSFDTSQVTDMRWMFNWCSNLSSVDVSSFDTSQVTDMSEMFNWCSNLSSVDVSSFDTSQVRSMSCMFNWCSNLSSVDVSSFDTSQVTDMSEMFYSCSDLSSVDVSSFDTSQVTDMSEMFYSCSDLSSVDASSFDTSQVTDMSFMFSRCSNLSSVDVSSFDTSQVTNMREMFSRCSNLSSVDASSFDTSQVTDMSGMFEYCSNLSSVDASSFDTSQVTDMRWMFYLCSSLSSVDVSSFDTVQVTDMSEMFEGCSSLSSVDVSSFDTVQVTDMSEMFEGCSSLSSVDVSSFDTVQVTDMSEMFEGCSSLSSVDVSSFDTVQVTDMSFMFRGCSNLSSVDVSSFDTSKVRSMSCMFCWCSNLSSVDVSSFDTSKVRSMSSMFSGCSNLSSVDVSSFDTVQVTDMGGMFSGCSNLSSVDVSSFDTVQVTDMSEMFDGCSDLSSVDLSSFDLSSLGDGRYMFEESGLTELDTPRNLSIEISLPNTYESADGQEYTTLPLNRSESIHLSVKKPAQYTISFDGNGATDGTMQNQTMVYESGEKLSANNFKRTGYVFTGWNTQADGKGTFYEEEADGSRLTEEKDAEVTLYAQWEKAVYEISYHLNDGKNNSENPISYDVTTEDIVLKNPTRTGYAFEGWYTDASLTEKITTIAKGSTGNKTLYASWKANEYTIVYKGNGSTSGSMDSTSCKYGSSYTLKANAFKRTGYSFAGWNTKADGTGTAYQDKASVKDLSSETGAVINLYANWTKVNYTITYNLNNGKNNSANPTSYDVTTAAITLKNPTRTGYTFTGWYTDAALTKKITTIAKGSTGNKTLSAGWKPNTYTITYKGNGSTSGSMTATSCKYGSSYALKANAFKKTGYSFAGWNTKADGTGTTYQDKASVKNLSSKAGAVVNLYAKWTKVKYTIAYHLNGGKNNSGNPVSYYVTSSSITLKNPTRTGYTFVGWYKDSAYKTKVTKITQGSTGNRALYAKWTPNKYSIVYRGNGSTSGSMTATSCKYGSSYALKANAFKKTGYSFVGWNTKADGTGTTYKNKASVKNLTSKNGGTINLYAKWSKVKYTITYKLNGGKNSSANPSSYYITTATITLKNPTRTGYKFAGWYKDSAYKSKVTKISKGSYGNRTLYAKWTPNKYNIVYKGNGSTSGSMTASKNCKYGSSYTLKANAFKKKGYVFAGRNTKADGSGKAYKNKASVKNLSSKAGATVTLYARWKKK